MPDGVMTDAAQTVEMSRPLRLYRLESALYKSVFAEKKNVYGRTVVVWFAVLQNADRAVGIVVSKRVFARAVDRNRAKRLMREAFRLSRAHLVPGVSVLLIARAGIAGKKCQEVVLDLERAWKRANIWTDTQIVL